MDKADKIEYLRERSAIRENDGGMSLNEADRAAKEDLKRYWETLEQFTDLVKRSR
ncbi:hypothetical protein KAR91_69730 [Candidatus Pacearchaeota archaeon]|nr:hypothetical protein [Candidatus Pacearchaeota archaeon]